ncbi:MAG: hypothetical protein WC623_21650, partial [Pedobacter sp.]|uniref:hypothetical protein n=1 Tax=Pedobacter sp. TaxID=1411316 RepID=UPI003565D6AE
MVGILLSATILFMLFGSVITNLTTGSLIQFGNRIDTFANYNGKCGSGTSNTIYYTINDGDPKYGTIQVPCSAPDGLKYLKDAVLGYAAGTIYDTIYFNNILHQSPQYNPDLPTQSYTTDVSPVGSTNINAITNVPINIPLTLKMFPQDTMSSDGSMTIGWYKITIFDSFMNPIKDHNWIQFTEPYTNKTIDFGFNPMYETTYYIALTSVKQNYTFISNIWNITEEFDSRDLKQITSRLSFSTPTPTSTPPTPCQTGQIWDGTKCTLETQL